MNRSPNPTPAHPAALWQRLSALLYDLFPLLALWLVVAGLSYWLRGAQPVAPGSLAAWMEFALLWLVTACYAVVSWRFGGQTVGMRAWRLRVVDDQGQRPSWSSLCWRFAAAHGSWALLGLGWLWPLWEPQGRTLHDLLSRTRLVKLPKPRA
ncbi:MAG: RDD family protein [Lysobacteraceae bacterium]